MPGKVERLIDVLLAALIVGLAAVAYSALTPGSFNPLGLFVVPMALIGSLLIGALFVFLDPRLVLFLALIIATVVFAIGAMRIGFRPVRVFAISVVLGGQTLGFAWLIFLLGIIA